MSPLALVFDASVTLPWVFEDEAWPYTDAVLEAFTEKKSTEDAKKRGTQNNYPVAPFKIFVALLC
jgi:hypothetical protein